LENNVAQEKGKLAFNNCEEKTKVMKLEELQIEITARAMEFIRAKMAKETYGLVISYNEVKN
jgi:hypothetical protein